MFFVDDQKPEVLEGDPSAEKCVRANHDAHIATCHPVLDLARLRGLHQTRKCCDLDPKAGKPLLECLHMLLYQNGRRRDDSYLFAGKRSCGGGTKGHFRLAEPDIAANQAVHALP